MYRYISLLIIAFTANSEQLKLNSLVDIDVFSTDIRAITTGSEPLQCSSGELIEYLKGANGTVYSDGTYWVDTNPSSPNNMSHPFDVEYKVNDAAWCSGSVDPGLPAWSGARAIGNGTGVFTDYIYSGIPEGESVFTLTCSAEPETTTYNLKQAVSKNELEISQIYNQILNLALNESKVFSWDILTGKIKTVKANNITLPDKFVLMIRQVGSEIYLIPSKDDFTVPDGYVETNPKYSTMIILGPETTRDINLNDVNHYDELPETMQSKHCSQYSPVNEAWINATIGQPGETCDLTNKKAVYLTAIVFEK